MRWFFVRESIGIRKDSIPVSPGKRNWRLCFRFSCVRDWSLPAASSLLTPLSISEFEAFYGRERGIAERECAAEILSPMAKDLYHVDFEVDNGAPGEIRIPD